MSFFRKIALYLLLPVFITVCIMGVMQYRTLSGIQRMYQVDEVIAVFEKMKQYMRNEYEAKKTARRSTGELVKLNETINAHLLTFEELKFMQREIRVLTLISSSVFPLLFIIMLLSGILYLMRNLFKPLKRLTEAMKVYTSGTDDFFPVTVSGSPESRLLIATTNSLVGTIAEQNKKIAVQSKFLGWRTAALEIAHEIKNCLVPAKLSAETVLETALDDGNVSLKNNAKRMIHSLRVLENMSKSIRDLSTMRVPCPELTDLSIVLGESVAFYRKQFAEIRFTGETCILSVDRMIMRSVFDNIIVNAIEAVNGYENGTVTVSLTGGENPVFECVDNGPGIDDSVKNKMFKLNFTTKKNGTGFGLYFVKKIVEDHGFTVECFSDKRERKTVIRILLGG